MQGIQSLVAQVRAPTESGRWFGWGSQMVFVLMDVRRTSRDRYGNPQFLMEFAYVHWADLHRVLPRDRGFLRRDTLGPGRLILVLRLGSSSRHREERGRGRTRGQSSRDFFIADSRSRSRGEHDSRDSRDSRRRRTERRVFDL